MNKGNCGICATKYGTLECTKLKSLFVFHIFPFQISNQCFRWCSNHSSSIQRGFRLSPRPRHVSHSNAAQIISRLLSISMTEEEIQGRHNQEPQGRPLWEVEMFCFDASCVKTYVFFGLVSSESLMLLGHFFFKEMVKSGRCWVRTSVLRIALASPKISKSQTRKQRVDQQQ